MHVIVFIFVALAFTLSQARIIPHVVRLGEGIGAQASAPQSQGPKNLTVFDSGKPPSKFQTGGIVWSGQQLGVRFLPAWARTGDKALVKAIAFYLGTENSKRSVVHLSLCGVSTSEGYPSSDCITEEYTLPSVRQVQVTWEPRESFFFETGTLYWFLVSGDAWIPQHSLSWLDGDVLFNGNSTVSAYKAPGKDWMFDAIKPNMTLPTLAVQVDLPRSALV
jgi:hypothetical protein